MGAVLGSDMAQVEQSGLLTEEKKHGTGWEIDYRGNSEWDKRGHRARA